MAVRYVALWKLHGANRIASGATTVQLAALSDPVATATLTVDPEPYCFHIDTSAAIGAQLLKGVFAPDSAATYPERHTAEVETVRAHRVKQAGTGVFLAFEGEVPVPAIQFSARREVDQFAVGLNGLSKAEIRERFRPHLEAVLTALGLILPVRADGRVEKIGDVIYAVEPDSQKPVYAFTFRGGSLTGSIATPLTEDAVAETTMLIPRLSADETMARPASLLITSLDRSTDELQAFIAAWSALEMFVNSTFKVRHKARWFGLLESAAPESAKPVLKRLDEVMGSRLRLSDKFLIIASLLDPEAASTDAEGFRDLKRVRDRLLHGLDRPSSRLPTEPVQKLVLKYMKLHLEAQAEP